ncbi:alanine racemase [Niveispirillum sp.]|uniref:alanine racemase n=1 Tax=Niveispirillum sp. TaxID=1917217 RepID=UPI001B7B5817|nr:alanine racemase [Niveispirillum sp.]MBP7336013.1 alanine racemase [Niveispirillum sp.]
MLKLAPLLSDPLPPGTKGLPPLPPGFTLDKIAGQGWRVLAGDVPLPAAVLKRPAMDRNIARMQEYLAASGMKLAPHGKTTMCPQLFERQLQAGAWGITVANIQQLALCHAIGVQRVLIANEVLGPAELAAFATMSAGAPDSTYHLLLDSVEGARQLQAAMAARPDAPAARVLIEVGFPGGRCGVRSLEGGLILADEIRRLDRLRLVGVEGYEGLLPDPQAVDAYLDNVVGLLTILRADGRFADPDHILLSAGGSAYFDLVARLFGGVAAPGIVPILRSGCYITHDDGFYGRLLGDVAARGQAPGLEPALEVWARVLSRPEPGLLVLSAGKRDLSHDIDLPGLKSWFRPGLHTAPQSTHGWRITKLSDQHAHVLAEMPAAATPLCVGDMVALGISHPCTTFDKWRVLLEVDDDYRVTGGLKTFF